MALNYKRVPFVTKYIEYPDIERSIKFIGGTPTATRDNGRPYYSLPAIRDTTTGTVVTDSAAIAEYLDSTYPDSPSGPLFPQNARAAIAMFEASLSQALSPVFDLVVPIAHRILNPVSQQYYRATREAMYGMKLKEVAPIGSARREELWQKAQEGFDQIAKFYEKNGKGKLWFLGDTFSFADTFAAAFFSWMMIVLGADSDEWKRVASWNEGRWARLVDATMGLRIEP